MDRGRLLKKIVADKKLGELSDGVYPGAFRPPMIWVTTGNFAVDWCISDILWKGGLPMGRVVEIFGDPSTGKSLMIAKIMGVVQAMGGIAIYDDVEESRDEVFMHNMGCDVRPEALMTMTNKTVESHFNSVLHQMRLIRESGFDKPIVIVLDSLAALSTKHEIETGLDKVDMARAKVIKAAMRIVGGDFAKSNVLYIVCNHVIQNIGQTFVSRLKPAKISPGGGGVKFHASVRIELDVVQLYQNIENLVTGVKVKVRVVKNKVAPPFRECLIDVDFKEGIDPFSGIFDILKKAGLVTSPTQGWYCYRDDPKKMRQEDIVSIVREEVMCGSGESSHRGAGRAEVGTSRGSSDGVDA